MDINQREVNRLMNENAHLTAYLMKADVHHKFLVRENDSYRTFILKVHEHLSKGKDPSVVTKNITRAFGLDHPSEIEEDSPKVAAQSSPTR